MGEEEESFRAESDDGESEHEAGFGEGPLGSTKFILVMRYEVRDITYKRRLRSGDEVGWESGGSSEQDLFRFRDVWEASSSLSESVECVREGVADGLREGGEERRGMSTASGDDVV